MPPTKRYRLRLKTLSFLSAVDTPAQETAIALLLKRAGAAVEIAGSAPVVKLDESLGLVFAWAWTSKVNGEDYVDLQGDVVSDGDDMLAAAAEFMAAGGAQDVMHDGETDGRVIFAMPMNAEVAAAFGVTSKTSGLMIAIRPSAATYEKFKSGELTGISLAGIGEREEIAEKRCGADVATMKRAVLTDDVLGHAHILDEDQQGGQTSYAELQTTGGMGYAGHSHPYVRNPDSGAIEIGMSFSHTHVVRGQTAAAAPAPAVEVDPADAEKVAKAAEVAAEKALDVTIAKIHTDAANSRQKFAARVETIAKRDGSTISAARTKAITSDAEAQDLYDAFATAPDREIELRAKALAAGAELAAEKAMAKLDTMIEKYCLDHDLEPHQARAKLEKLAGPRALMEEIAEHRETIRASKATARRQMEQARKTAEEQREADEHTATLASASPTKKLFDARVAEIALAKKLERSAALTFAIQHDPMASALYEALNAERQHGAAS